MNQENIRILIADDHAVVRSGIKLLLDTEPDLQVVGEAGDGLEAICKYRELMPDLLLLDIMMPGMTGLQAAKAISQEFPNSRVMFLTMHEGDEYFFQALAVGASGYVVKGASSDEVVSAIRSVNSGGVYLQPSLAKKLVSDYLRNKSTAVYDGLTPREGEVLKLIADGSTNKEIAVKLSISVTTVQTHRAHVMEKLNLHSQAELIKYAMRKGILVAD